MVLGGFDAVGGLLIMLLSGAILWILRPRNGEPRRLVMMPYLETAIPIAIMAGLVLGFAAFIAGIAPTILGSTGSPA
jgi:UDP-N-acetylmuramyl pentapeptide phosphotransferase/UDP-N-acetylglucosamine-1-phosphate transferase